MNKIALIQPSYDNIVLDTTSIPLGLAWLSAYLKEDNFDVDCYDLSINNVLEDISWKKYKIIGIQIHSHESLPNVLKLIQYLKKESNSIIIVGGPVATLSWEVIIKISEVDYIILNEGEIPLRMLVSYLLRNKGCIEKISGIIYRNPIGSTIHNPNINWIKDLDTLPLPDREAFSWQNYKQWSIVTSRGCPFNCHFCTSPSFWKGTYRQRSPAAVYKEICYLKEQYNVNKFFILDDSFTFNKLNTNKLLDLIISGKYDFEWACLTRADLLDEKLLVKMKDAGCTTISIGVESANQDTLDYLHKNIKIETYKKVIPIIKNVGIRVRCSFIFGFPNETIKHLKNNIDFILSTTPDEVQIYPLFPYEGTKIYNENMFTKISEMKKKDALVPIIETHNLKAKDIKTSVLKCVEELKKIGYIWLSSYEIAPVKNEYQKVIMTEFAPIQKLK